METAKRNHRRGRIRAQSPSDPTRSITSDSDPETVSRYRKAHGFDLYSGFPPSTEQQERARYWLSHHETQFKQTGNALHIWEAIGESLSVRLPLPEWVIPYLTEVAGDLAQHWRQHPPRRNAINSAVADALKIKGRSGFNPFDELRRPSHEYFVALQVYQCQTANRHFKWKAVFEEVASRHPCDLCERKLSWQQVRRIWYARAFEVIPRHLIERAKSQKLDDILRQP